MNMITRITAWLVLAFFSAGSAAQSAPVESAIALNTASGALQGGLLLPAASTAAAGGLPVVLIIAGSGPTDRDGNSAGLPGPNHSLKLLASYSHPTLPLAEALMPRLLRFLAPLATAPR